MSSTSRRPLDLPKVWSKDCNWLARRRALVGLAVHVCVISASLELSWMGLFGGNTLKRSMCFGNACPGLPL